MQFCNGMGRNWVAICPVSCTLVSWFSVVWYSVNNKPLTVRIVSTELFNFVGVYGALWEHIFVGLSLLGSCSSVSVLLVAWTFGLFSNGEGVVDWVKALWRYLEDQMSSRPNLLIGCVSSLTNNVLLSRVDQCLDFSLCVELLCVKVWVNWSLVSRGAPGAALQPPGRRHLGSRRDPACPPDQPPALPRRERPGPEGHAEGASPSSRPSPSGFSKDAMELLRGMLHSVLQVNVIHVVSEILFAVWIACSVVSGFNIN